MFGKFLVVLLYVAPCLLGITILEFVLDFLLQHIKPLQRWIESRPMYEHNDSER